MFRSKRRPVIFPQSEHLRMVGALALAWGNSDFDLPPVAHESMVLGMSQHDRGYGLMDVSPVGGMSEEEWQPIARRGFSMPCSDIVADTIVKHHIRRLAANDSLPRRRAMAKEFTQAIDDQLARHHLAGETFERIDRITDLLDRLSFSFCFENPAVGELAIHPRNGSMETVAVRWRVEDGLARLDPWPFSEGCLRGYLLGYPEDGYPDRPDPFIAPYRVEPG